MGATDSPRISYSVSRHSHIYDCQAVKLEAFKSSALKLH
jgi:hypothetical protein